MQSANVYLNFNGNCAEAFEHYKKVFGTEYAMIMPFNQMPSQEGMPPMSEEEGKKIMHVTLPIGEGTLIMGSDVGGPWAELYKVGSNFSVSVNTDSEARANELYAGLSEGGQAPMPMADTFWGAYFGMCVDKFGISWMVNFDRPQS
jgi:PhnB protein